VDQVSLLWLVVGAPVDGVGVLGSAVVEEVLGALQGDDAVIRAAHVVGSQAISAADQSAVGIVYGTGGGVLLVTTWYGAPSLLLVVVSAVSARVLTRAVIVRSALVGFTKISGAV